MKRFFCIALAFVVLPLFALADIPDISGLSFDELLSLRDQLDQSIWNAKEWKQVEVPAGFYVIGVDIPAGHWTLKPLPGESITIEYFKNVDQTGKGPADAFNNYYSEVLADESSSYASFIYVRQTDIDMKENFYLSVVNGPAVIFEPYISKPKFSFMD